MEQLKVVSEYTFFVFAKLIKNIVQPYFPDIFHSNLIYLVNKIQGTRIKSSIAAKEVWFSIYEVKDACEADDHEQVKESMYLSHPG